MSRSLARAWSRLGIAATTDAGAIRRAYADALRAMDVDADVAGFAELRAARDAALAWARSQAAAPPAEPLPAPLDDAEPGAAPEDTAEDTAPGTWPYAAPLLDRAVEAPVVAGANAGHAAGHDALVPALPLRAAQGPGDAQFIVPRPVFGPPRWHDAGAIATGDTVPLQAAVRADHALHDLLLEGPGVEFGLSRREEAAAQGHIATLIAHAEAGPVDLWRRTEEWLAETLARGWPRSAPLLDRVAHTFGWAGRGATTADTPAIAFLVPRVGTTPFTRTHRGGNATLDDLLLDGRDPLTDVEEVRARALLDDLLAEANAATVDEHGRIESHLADLLVEAWPRSAPLLAPAAEAFAWEDERGQLHERNSIAFLNARLAGLRFVDKVRVPGHALHAAWKELTRDGKRRGLFVSRRKVRELLDGVRSHFPEVEYHFNPVLVTSWDKQGGGSGKIWRFPWVIGILLAIRLAILLGEQSHDGRLPLAPDLPATITPAEAESDIALNAAIARVFGTAPGGAAPMTFVDVQRLDTNLADTLLSNRRQTPDASVLETKVHTVIRQRMMLALLTGPPQFRDDLARWRLALLRAGQAAGADTCVSMLQGSALPDGVILPKSVASAEQDLARRLLEARQIDPPRPKAGEQRFSVPGLLSERVIAATGLKPQRVTDALLNKGAPVTLCAARVEFLEQALKWRGPERDAILRAI